jgi:hypothetical protein
LNSWLGSVADSVKRAVQEKLTLGQTVAV